jgi:DnaJ-class molecular chaperone
MTAPSVEAFPGSGDAGSVSAVATSPDGATFLYSGGSGKLIMVRENGVERLVASGQEVSVLVLDGNVVFWLTKDGDLYRAALSQSPIVPVLHAKTDANPTALVIDGNDLYVEVPLNFSTVALGGEIRIPTLEGEEPFKVPEGTESGQAFRLRGRGMPDVTGRGRGDLFVTMKVTTPKKLTREQKKLLEQLASSLPKEKFEPTPVSQEDKGLFGRVKDIFG